MKKSTSCLSLITLIFALTGCGTSAHVHTFSDKWEFNDSYHWHAATCGHDDLTKDLGEHIDEDKDYHCDVCDHELSSLEYHMVVFADGKELLSDPIILLNNGKIYRPTDPVKKGHNFMGWYDTPDFSGDVYDFDTPVTENLTLYAKFDASQYKITYHNDDNIVHNDPEGYVYGVGVASLDESAHDSKGQDKFYGWYFDERFTKPATSIGKDSIGDIDLYAKRSKIYKIKYENWPDGINNPNPEEYTALDEIALKCDDVKSHSGFSNVVLKEGETVVNKIKLGSTGNKTISLSYDVTKTKVTFDPNGGSLIPDQPYINVDFGEGLGVTKFELPLISSDQAVNIYDQKKFKIPEKEGYCFGGYFLDEELKTRISETENNVLTCGSTIYAKWEEITDAWNGQLPCSEGIQLGITTEEWSAFKGYSYMIPYYVKNAFMSLYLTNPTVFGGGCASSELLVKCTKHDGTVEDYCDQRLFSDQEPFVVFINEERNLSAYKSLEINCILQRIDGGENAGATFRFTFEDGHNADTAYRSGMIKAKETTKAYEEEYLYWSIPSISAEREGYVFDGWVDENGNKIDFAKHWEYTESEIKVKASWVKA